MLADEVPSPSDKRVSCLTASDVRVDEAASPSDKRASETEPSDMGVASPSDKRASTTEPSDMGVDGFPSPSDKRVSTSASSEVMTGVYPPCTDVMASDSTNTKLNKKVNKNNHRGAAAVGVVLANIAAPLGGRGSIRAGNSGGGKSAMSARLRTWSPPEAGGHY